MAAFTSDRLTYSGWDESDLDRFVDMYGRPDVVRYLVSVPEPVRDAARALEIINRWREIRADPRYGFWAARRPDGVVAGTVLLIPMVPSAGRPWNGEVEVGWHLHPDSRRRGYATEMAGWALNKGFGDGLSEIHATVFPENEPSLAVCRRLGMAALGRSTDWDDVELEAFRAGREDWRS